MAKTGSGQSQNPIHADSTTYVQLHRSSPVAPQDEHQQDADTENGVITQTQAL